eukprot:CAMPEP_0116031952 /NCGR_PEP_ID=MMETSP0321-20121206/17871_1 /TAXON_ID=163516 /ORGANISM="Leptocylindrus danicus var. danicus, Strain B650" /LENGTH=477 /DNA_ID=CAMNT_0003507277 /DNA_START=222 /DNA_END=1655 /DNA_ORIENTATION=+
MTASNKQQTNTNTHHSMNTAVTAGRPSQVLSSTSHPATKAMEAANKKATAHTMVKTTMARAKKPTAKVSGVPQVTLSAGAAAAKISAPNGRLPNMQTPSTVTSGSGSSGENTGRWTAEEHRLFLQGLEQHGKGWKKIASLIKSRTVVQIRTHAQKYFQKLAKARQNGEEGEVSMEGRGSISNSKKKRNNCGTKRKGITSVVASAAKDETAWPPKVAPALAPYVSVQPPTAPPTTAHFEDSLYRFLTPASEVQLHPGAAVACAPHQQVVGSALTNVNAPARPSASIILPSDLPGLNDNQASEGSPTCVADLTFPFPFGTKEPPQWFTKGADVEELLQEAGTLDWLADPGNDALTSDTTVADIASLCSTSEDSANGTDGEYQSVSSSVSIPKMTASSTDISIPNLFDQANVSGSNKRFKTGLSSTNIHGAHDSATSMSNLDELSVSMTGTPSVENFNVFDANFDEQAFVSALLDPNDSV